MNRIISLKENAFYKSNLKSSIHVFGEADRNKVHFFQNKFYHTLSK